jgi:hypothetical protein
MWDAKIAEQIGAFLARGTGLIEHWPKKKIGTYFFAQLALKIFLPNQNAGS